MLPAVKYWYGTHSTADLLTGFSKRRQSFPAQLGHWASSFLQDSQYFFWTKLIQFLSDFQYFPSFLDIAVYIKKERERKKDYAITVSIVWETGEFQKESCNRALAFTAPFLCGNTFCGRL